MSIARSRRRQTPITFPPMPELVGLSALQHIGNRIRGFVDQPEPDQFEAVPLMTSLGTLPAVELTESADEITLTAKLAGVDRKNIDVTIDNDVVTLFCERAEGRTEGEPGQKLFFSEQRYGSLKRSFTLTHVIDAARATAELAKGFLTVRMPKSSERTAEERRVAIAEGK